MMSTVRKSPSVVVRPPAEPMTKGDTSIKLSPLDKGNFPLSVLLLYQSPINNAANTIKSALSQALVHYYPFCGRIVSGADGDGGSYIECTGDGVEFIAASADCSLQAAKLLERLPCGGGDGDTTSSSPLDELAVCYPIGSYGPGDPLLSMQVTEFACGGFVLGVTWSHAIADAVGIAQFLRAVGELARGLPSPSVVPVRWDEAVSSQPPPTDPGRDAAVMMMSQLAACFGPAKGGHSEPLPLAFLDVTIPSSFIDRVKAEFPSCTTFEVVLAVLWQCRTRAIMSSSSRPPDTLSFLAFPVNVRKHVGAKDGYYGNCVIDKLVMAASSTVASADIVDLVNMIKHAKVDDQVADDDQQLNKKKEDNVPADQPEEKKDENGSRNQLLLQGLDDWRYSMFSVSSWRNIGFEEPDFGSGQPARVMCHGVPPLPSCVACLRCKGRDGANVLSYCVKEEHADAFLGEIAKLS